MVDTPEPAESLTPAATPSTSPAETPEAHVPAEGELAANPPAPPSPPAAEAEAPSPAADASAPSALVVPLELGRIAQDLQIRKHQVETVVELLEQGHDVAFLARFRRDRFGGLGEEQIQQIRKRLQLQRQLADRKQAILRNLQTQGRLTAELRDAILHADNNKRVEDLYLPFKPKKKSAAATAREKGLEPLAQAIFQKDPAVQSLADLWPTFVNPEKKLTSIEEVQAAVKLLLAEIISEQASVRDAARRQLWEHAKLVVKKNPALPEGQGGEFKDYFDFGEGLRHLAPHRIAAINRGEKSQALQVKLEYPLEKLQQAVTERLLLAEHPHSDLLRDALPDALTQFLLPSLEREIRRDLTDRSEEHAAQVLAKNLRRMLMQPPLPPTRVLAIDPGFRHGCRVAVLSETGELLEHAVIHPHVPPEGVGKKAKAAKAPEPVTAEAVHPVSEAATPEPPASATPEVAAAATTESPPTAEVAQAEPVAFEASGTPPPPSKEQKRAEAMNTLEALVKKHAVQVIALGNGNSSRETEALVTELIAERLPELSYHVVPEHGATHYSLSPLGREELPHVEAPVRAAVSLGRRLQDPLRELAKIEPLQLGLGFYHQDVPEKRLKDLLAEVVESVINEVGLEVNTAGVPQLRYVAGLNPLRATNLVQYRQANGNFINRADLKNVPGLTDLAWTQAAAFLRVADGADPLDRTWLHPDQYETARKILESSGATPEALLSEETLQPLRDKFAELDLQAESAKVQLTPEAFDSILRALARPGKDPRSDHPAPLFKKKQLRVEDLQPGMELRGTVLNVVDFGAFVDVGLKDNGLVHISQLANRFVKSPYDLVFVGDVVTVWVLNTDANKNRVSLTMIPPGTERRAGGPHRGSPAPGSADDRPPRPAGERPPRRQPRFPAQIATPGRPSGPLPRVEPTRPAGNRPPRPAAAPPPTAPPRPAPPRREKPLPKLSQDALKGKSALRTFGELKALYEAKKPEPKPTAEAGPATPESVPPPSGAIPAADTPQPPLPAPPTTSELEGDAPPVM